jgi:hypothetical protein
VKYLYPFLISETDGSYARKHTNSIMHVREEHRKAPLADRSFTGILNILALDQVVTSLPAFETIIKSPAIIYSRISDSIAVINQI